MLSLFCSRLHFVIVSDQNLAQKKTNNTEMLCEAGMFYGKHLK